jgi:hypothetical protein
MPAISDAVAQLTAAGTPVLFLDTCSILDVIRAPLPERKLGGCAEAALELLAMATETPPRCRVVVGSFVPAEWHNNSPAVCAELEKRLKRMDEEAELFHRVCGHLTLSVGFGRAQYQVSGLPSQLLDVSSRLLGAALVLEPHPDTNSRAFGRVAISQRRPSHKGGELKDCTIFEECLKVCRQLQSTAFSRKLVFCSSNIDDYCAPGVVPHADIAADCAAVGLRFTTTLPWAVSELKT